MHAISFSQTTQKVRGIILELESEMPIQGAIVELQQKNVTLFKGTTSVNGEYSIENVLVGKYEVLISAESFESSLGIVTVNSGKESIYDKKLQENIQEVEEVVILAQKAGEVKNEMAMTSAQQFSVEETERFAGSRGDPARMASNFAGVQGADDSRNDIVIRGNSPLGVVYKVEGIDIPNPSHFAISGSTGGPVSIINNKSLANSDFFMSAFPAEYGNSLSGIFDLKLRNGNNEQHEFSGQFGILGTEILAEGPLSKKSRSTYLIMGRYSTLSMFQSIGIKLGTDAVPVYGDGAFRFTFPTKRGGQIALWGLGGKSNIAIKISEQKKYSTEFYGEGDRDQYFGTGMLTSGLTFKKPISEKTFFTFTLANSLDEQHANHNLLIRSLDTVSNNGTPEVNISVDSIYPLMGYKFKTTRGSLYTSFNHKIDKKNVLKAGINMDLMYFNMNDSVLNVANTVFINRWDYKGANILIQPFIQWKCRVNDRTDVTAGLHAQYYSFSKSLSWFEPRLGWKTSFKNNAKIFAGLGIHSQTQPLYTYLYHKIENGKKVYENRNMDFAKSFHSAFGFEKSLGKGFNLHTEVYYQYLFNVPVEEKLSSFSIINQGSGFARFFPNKLKNEGTGHNYGIELTLQKFFSKSFYILSSTSLYNSRYRGSDGVVRNTSYNGKYTSNLLIGKEIKLNAKNTIGIGGKITVAGGKRYGYVDITQTQLVKELIFSDSLFNERKFKDYFRMDVKISWKLNANKITHEIGLDLVNVLNTRNLLSLTYAPNLAEPTAEPIAEKTQLGFLPIFYYRIEFKLAKTK